MPKAITPPTAADARVAEDAAAQDALRHREHYAAKNEDPPPYEPLAQARETREEAELREARERFDDAVLRRVYSDNDRVHVLNSRDIELLEKNDDLTVFNIGWYADEARKLVVARDLAAERSREDWQAEYDTLKAEADAAQKEIAEAPAKVQAERQRRADALADAKKAHSEYRNLQTAAGQRIDPHRDLDGRQRKSQREAQDKLNAYNYDPAQAEREARSAMKGWYTPGDLGERRLEMTEDARAIKRRFKQFAEQYEGAIAAFRRIAGAGEHIERYADEIAKERR